MKNLLFSAQGRIARWRFWTGVLIILAGFIVVGVIESFLGVTGHGETEAGGVSFSYDTSSSLPGSILAAVYALIATVAGLCLGIKRYHDRDKSGAWVLIQLVPLIGAIWYVVETGFLKGTRGPNRFGPDPLGAPAPAGVIASV